MPTEPLAATLEQGLTAACADFIEVVEAGLGELPQDAVTAVVDEMVAGSQFPIVLVGARVACVGGVDLQAVLQVLDCA